MIWAVIAGVLVGGAVVPVVGQWRPGRSEGPRARARSAHAELGFALSTAPQGPAADRAQERFTTAGSLLAQARTRRACALAERVAREGLQALGRPAA